MTKRFEGMQGDLLAFADAALLAAPLAVELAVAGLSLLLEILRSVLLPLLLGKLLAHLLVHGLLHAFTIYHRADRTLVALSRLLGQFLAHILPEASTFRVTRPLAHTGIVAVARALLLHVTAEHTLLIDAAGAAFTVISGLARSNFLALHARSVVRLPVHSVLPPRAEACLLLVERVHLALSQAVLFTELVALAVEILVVTHARGEVVLDTFISLIQHAHLGLLALFTGQLSATFSVLRFRFIIQDGLLENDILAIPIRTLVAKVVLPDALPGEFLTQAIFLNTEIGTRGTGVHHGKS